MAFKLFEVKGYFVSLKRKGTHGELANIDCWGEGEPQKILSIYFMPGDITLPSNTSRIEQTGIVEGVLYQPADKYAWYLDLLRNEGPTQMRIDTDDPNRNCIMTYGLEPVGDGDNN